MLKALKRGESMKNNKLLVFIILCIFSSTSYAEYYFSDGCSSGACAVPCETKRVYKRHYVAKKHHYKKRHVYTGVRYKRNSYTVSKYYYYPQPVCGCERTYVPAKCGCGGSYTPGHWVSERRSYVKYVGPYNAGSFHETWYSPVNDRATADDYFENMQVN